MKNDQSGTSATGSGSQQASTTSLDMPSSSGLEASQYVAKSSSVGFSPTNTDFTIALDLFPEFLLQGTHGGNRLLSSRKSEEMRFKGLLILEINDRNRQNHSKSCEDIVQWIKTEYGI